METEVNISFGANSVFVQAGHLNQQLPNLYALEDNKILDIGKTVEEIASFNPQGWEKIKDRVTFEPIFNPQNFDLDMMYWATRLFAGNISQELQGQQIFEKILCNLNIPKYELLPETVRESFELSLEGWSKLKILTINGITVFSKDWRYRLAEFALHWGRPMIGGALVLAFIWYPELFFGIFNPLHRAFSVFSLAIVPLLMILVVMWGGEIAWLFAMQLLLPKSTLRRIFALYQFQSISSNKMSLSKLFAKWILGKDE